MLIHMHIHMHVYIHIHIHIHMHIYIKESKTSTYSTKFVFHVIISFISLLRHKQSAK